MTDSLTAMLRAHTIKGEEYLAARRAQKAKATQRPLNEHEAYCLAHAAYFTSVRWEANAQGRRSAQRMEHATLEAAKAAGNGDGRTMIYAITVDGRDAHIANV